MGSQTFGQEDQVKLEKLEFQKFEEKPKYFQMTEELFSKIIQLSHLGNEITLKTEAIKG